MKIVYLDKALLGEETLINSVASLIFFITLTELLCFKELNKNCQVFAELNLGDPSSNA
jgi:hypothetical protein